MSGRCISLVIALSLASTVGAGPMTAPLDENEPLSRGIARWAALEADGVCTASRPGGIRAGDLRALWRTARAAGERSLIVVNCRYVGERVWVELWAVDEGVVVASWSGLIAATAFPVELPPALCGLLEELGFDAASLTSTGPTLDELKVLAADPGFNPVEEG